MVAVGYDCIPVVSADLVPAYEPQRFCRLPQRPQARPAHRRHQRLRHRRVRRLRLRPARPGPPRPDRQRVPPARRARPPRPPPPADPARPPLVLCVGSLEPRKNHLALLYAAERLWREGLDFQLLLIAGSGWGEDIPAHIRRLQHAGRPLTIRTSATDTELAAAYQAARFSVLRLPPRGLRPARRRIPGLGHPRHHHQLRQHRPDRRRRRRPPHRPPRRRSPRHRHAPPAHRRRPPRHPPPPDPRPPPRTWEHYATELWDHLVPPELQPLTTHPHP